MYVCYMLLHMRMLYMCALICVHVRPLAYVLYSEVLSNSVGSKNRVDPGAVVARLDPL